MIWYSSFSVCFDELIGKDSVEKTSPGLCWGRDGSTSSGDYSGETGMNGGTKVGRKETARSMEAEGCREGKKKKRLKKADKE